MTTRKERLLQKLNPKLLKMTPKLSEESGSFINLDSDNSLEDGAKQLMMRFWRNQDLCEKNKRNTSQTEVELIITSTKYSEVHDILTERLKLPFIKNEEEDFSDRPGKNLQKLKMQLQEKMNAKWEEEYKKRVKENKLNKGYKQSKHKEKKHSHKEEDSDEDFDPNNFSEEEDDDEEKIYEDGTEGDIEDEADVEDYKRNDASAPEEADQPTAGESPIESSKEIFEDMESCSLPPAYQPGGGLLYGGSELTQCDESLPQNLLSPSLRLSVPESPQSRSLNDSTQSGKDTVMAEDINNSFSVRNKLFSQNPNDSFDLNDAYEFCSGKFPDECLNSKVENEAVATRAINCNFAENDLDEDEVEKVINEEEEDQNKNQEESDEVEDDWEDDEEVEVKNETLNGPKVRRNIIIFDDSEDEEEEVENSQTGEIEETHEVSKILSDEEDANEKTKKKRKNLQYSDDEDEDDVKESEKEDENDEERSVHYDSEENEINPREFFEKEAELSGSEWSGDEDERGLDEFDVEEGDMDNLDDEQVRSQLEKIHLRQVLDNDAREVRLIQEILFEDGDLHSDGKGRDRKFKWKNLGGTFEENGEVEAKEEGGNSSEDEGAEEEQQRKLRHERELFLMEKRKNGDEDSEEEIIENFHSIKVTSVKSSVKVTENCRNVLDYTEIGKHVTVSKSRGSFLTRNEEFLSKLAKVTSTITDNLMGPKHSKNFVFATKSPEKEPDKTTACKRQVEDAEIRGRRDKKFKILPPDVDTGPSILDLLV